MTVGLPSRSHREFPATTAAPRAARRFVRDSFTELRAPDSVVADFELAVSELVANLVEYGDGRDLTVCVDADDAQWLMEVHGGRVIPVALRDPDRWAVSRGEDDRGRGLGIVRAVMSRVRVERVDGVVVVRCSVPIVPA